MELRNKTQKDLSKSFRKNLINEDGNQDLRPKSAVKQFKRSGLTRQSRLRQNYIKSRGEHYTTLQNKIEEISSRPDFNRFIPIKTPVIADNAKLLAQYCSAPIEDKQKKNAEGKFTNRRKLLFMRRPRPSYNSPFRTRLSKQTTETIEPTEPPENTEPSKRQRLTTGTLKRSRIISQEPTEQNSMLIKQMVTRADENSHLKKRASHNPYKSGARSSLYYVSEIIKYYQVQDSVVREHISNSIYFHQLLIKYDNTDDFSRDKPLKFAQKEHYKNKITVVFDLDETLVHCFEDLSEPHEVELSVSFPGGCTMIAPLNIRPYARQLLAELSKDFQLMIFTASHEAYANEVINFLDPEGKFIQHRLYRRHCDYIEEGYYVKDLRILNRDISRVVLVDNAAYSYCFQVNNGIPILPYYQGSSDFELRALRDYLYRLKDCLDVRRINAQTFKLTQYNNFAEAEQLVQKLYLHK